MHGTIRMVLELDGEIVQNVDVQPGYLHRGFEKSCERGTWAQVFPYTDRLNYVSPMLNNVGYALAVEKLLGIEVPRPRAVLPRDPRPSSPASATTSRATARRPWSSAPSRPSCGS
jgi:NADH:ubiquinone oxidoreductase subunit D